MPHQYLRKTSRGQEKRLRRANERASLASGMPGYGTADRERGEQIRGVGEKRPLRRSEFIDLHGHPAWLKYVEKHGLPETHKWADAHMHKLSSIGG